MTPQSKAKHIYALPIQAKPATPPVSADSKDEEIARLKECLFQMQEAAKGLDLASADPKGQAELAAMRQPILADDGRSLGQVLHEILDEGLSWDRLLKGDKEQCKLAAQAVVAAARPQIEAECLAQAVRRMEAVPVKSLADAAMEPTPPYGLHGKAEAVRARLLAAAKGEGQAMAKNIPGDKCPLCGAEEVESNTPRTTYACGSSDYDGRPETFHPGDQCDGPRVVVNEPPQDEEPAWIPHDGGPCPLKDEEVEEWEVKWPGGFGATFKFKKPSNFPTWGAKDLFYRVLRWKPGFGPEAKAQPTTSPCWTPTVGQTVRLKSGGPVMTVHHISKDGSIACTHNMNGAFEFATLPAACLTPAQP